MRKLVPAYQRQGREVGVIHFGLGAFHRGHQAVYFDEAMRNGLGEWGVFGISPRSATVTESLRKQEFCYTVNVREGSEQRPSIVGSIFDGALFDLDNSRLQRAIISPELKLLTVTVTEKAYVAGITPESMPNRLLDMLLIRFESELNAPTIISCDNLPANGEYLRQVLITSAGMRGMDGDFQGWLRNLSIPNSMVDRIVPAITPQAITEFERAFGYRDESLISTEPFRQWVVAPHPHDYALGALGIEVSPEIERYERMKLRLFNGAHSTTAYFSQLSDIDFVYQAMAIPEWNSFITRLQDQISKSFVAPDSIDPSMYSASARARISNSALAHRSGQIAMDGSAKLPQRLFRAMGSLRESGNPRERIAFAIALWVRFLQSGLQVTDPLANLLIERARNENPLDAVGMVMQTPGLPNPVHESDWPLIADALEELSNHSPLDVARNL